MTQLSFLYIMAPTLLLIVQTWPQHPLEWIVVILSYVTALVFVYHKSVAPFLEPLCRTAITFITTSLLPAESCRNRESILRVGRR